MIKLFVSDMDGTLLYDEADPTSREISLENRNAVLKLHESGVRFMMASGRDHFYRTALEAVFGFQVDAIGMNGCNVVLDDQLLCDHGLTHQDTLDVLDALQHSPVQSNFLGINSRGDYVFQHIDRLPFEHFRELALKGILKNVPAIPLSKWIKDPAHPPFNKLVGMVNTIEERNTLLAYFQKHFSHRLDIIFSGRENIEIMPKDISKGSALLELMRLKGYGPKEVAVIGDSMNDLTMLQATPYSFAMSHSEDLIKEVSHYVVHSVAQAIEVVLEINAKEAADAR